MEMNYNEEAKFQIKKEIDGIITDCMHINVRLQQLKDRYGIQLRVEPNKSVLWDDGNDSYTMCRGGADFQVFRGGQELAEVLDSHTYIDKALGNRRLKFKYRECSFIQLATGNAIFRRAFRRSNSWTRAVNESVDE